MPLYGNFGNCPRHNNGRGGFYRKTWKYPLAVAKKTVLPNNGR